MHRWLILTVAAIPLMFNAFRPAPPSFVWWTSGALEKIRPYDSPPVKLKQTVQISAARNEFDAFQIVFRAGLQDLDGMDLDISDLKGPNDAVLSNKNVTIYFERDLNFARPSSIEGKAGEWPDALIPRTDRYFGEKRNAFPFKLAKQRNQPIWIEVYVPPSTKPGTYHGAVTVSIDGKRDEMIPVTNSYRLGEKLANAVLLTYPDAGHGSLFQYPESFTRQAAAFLSSESESAAF